MFYRSRQPLKINDGGVRALKYVNGKFPLTSRIISEANYGLSTFSPILCDEGTGGTYFLKNQKNKNVAVFKPGDEDPLSANNPKKQIVYGFSGLKAGDGVFREVLAYELDPTLVPQTCIAEVKHPMFSSPKIGSLQYFVQNAESTEEYGPSMYSVEDVHRIALLDIRIVNCDRNGENILVRKEKNRCHLIPIDHAFSLPVYSSFDNLKHFEWMNYRQSKLPMSQDVKEQIQSIDINRDVAVARAIGINKESLVSMQIANIILKTAVDFNKTFFEIGKFMCSKELHNLCKKDTSVNQLLEDVSNLATSSFQ